MTNASTGGSETPATGAAPVQPGAGPAAQAEERKSARPPAPRSHEIRFTTFPKLLFLWPLLLAGLAFWPLSYWGWVSDAALGWIYIWIGVVVLLTLGIDVNRNQAAFWLVVIGLFWILGLWLKDTKHITIFGDIYRWFASLGVTYSRGFGLALSVLLLVPYVIMLIWSRLNARWRITHNEFEHYSFGRMDDSLGRGAKTIRTDFPDVLELLLGLAGTLIVYNSTGTQELRRVPHVMFLPFVRRRLNRILERTAITTLAAQEDDEEA